MPEIVRPNNPYARPINATRPEGQMLVGEFYGERARDKRLSHETGGRSVAPANRYSGAGIVEPVDMDAPPKRGRGRPPGSKTRPRDPLTGAVIDVEPIPDPDVIDVPLDLLDVPEDDLFG